MMKGAYQFKPPDVPVVPQIISEVEMIHQFKNESQRMLGGRIHPDERDDVLAPETTTRRRLFVEPLPNHY
jgi:hypothetical protein